MMLECGTVFGEAGVGIELAITLHQAGQNDEAAEHLHEALDLADRLDLQPQRAKALDTLATIMPEDLPRPGRTATLEG
jgi:thioredoxin-like negative regulator of GroEL